MTPDEFDAMMQAAHDEEARDAAMVAQYENQEAGRQDREESAMRHF